MKRNLRNGLTVSIRQLINLTKQLMDECPPVSLDDNFEIVIINKSGMSDDWKIEPVKGK